MCRHVSFQMRFGLESVLTDMTPFFSDVQMDRVLVARQITFQLRTK